MKKLELPLKRLIGIIVLFFAVTGSLYSFAAESFHDAVNNGEVKGEIKLWYQTNDIDTNGKDIFDSGNSIFDAGLSLGYITDNYKGFSAGVSFYAIDDLGAYDNIANNSIHGVDHSSTASWVGEAYLAYNRQNTLIKLGRQNIKSPLINSDGWAVFPNSFEAIYVENKDVPDTCIVASWVTEERTLKSDTFNDFVDGGLMIGASNKSLPNTELNGYYYHIRDTYDYDIDALYFDASVKVKAVDISAQYMYFNPDSGNTDETSAVGLKVSSKISKITLTGALSSVGKGTLNAARFSDSGIKTPLYTATICGDGDIAGATDTDSFKLSIGLSPVEKLTITGSYGYYDHGSATSARPDDESTSAELTLKYTGFENFTIFSAFIHSDHHGVGAWKGCTESDSLNTFRVWVSYKF